MLASSSRFTPGRSSEAGVLLHEIAARTDISLGSTPRKVKQDRRAGLLDSVPPRKRGFAAMDPEKHRRIGSLGGMTAKAAGKGHRFTTQTARAAATKDGRGDDSSDGAYNC